MLVLMSKRLNVCKMAGEPAMEKLLLCVLNNKHFNVNDCAAGSRQSSSESIRFIHYTNLLITSSDAKLGRDNAYCETTICHYVRAFG